MVKRLLLAVTLTATFAASLPACSKKGNDEAPPPLPTATAEPSVAPPPVTATASVVQLAPTPPAPGQAPTTLSEAIMFSKPQMRDSTGAPDEGSATLQRYWAAKLYPWAQLEATPATSTAAFLANPDSGRGMKICEQGQIQTLTTTTPTPPQHEGVMVTKDGVTLSLGALADITGMKPNGPGKFCGIASGIQTITTPDGKQTRAIRLTGEFDTPANRGGGGSQFSSLRACCQALQQNSASMPPPQNMYAMAAAQYCMATVSSISSPQQKDAMLAGIRGALKGAPMPGMCR